MPDTDSRLTIVEARIAELDNRQNRADAVIAQLEASIADMRGDMNDGLSTLKELVGTGLSSAINSQPEWAARESNRLHSVVGVWIGVAGTLLLALITVIAASNHLF